MKKNEARRIIQFGNSSHIVSLPKEWLVRNKLGKGDLIFFEENENGDLILNTQKKSFSKPEKSAIIDAENKDWKILKREIVSAYLKNYTNIKIAGKGLQKRIKQIRNTIGNLPTMEVVKQTKEEVITKVFLDPEKIKYEELTVRIDIMIRALFQDVKKLLEKKKISEKDVQELLGRDEDINGLFYLSLKIFREKLENPTLLKYTTLPDLFDSWHANFNLEYIADRMKEIIPLIRDYNLSLNQKLKNDFLDIIKKIEAVYVLTMKSRANQDKEHALKLATKKAEIFKECDILSRKNWNKKGVPQLCENLKRIGSRIHSIGRRVYG